ncbi:MAG: dienelactone hydrolase family protein [Ilumatobacteraceae bacterium]
MGQMIEFKSNGGTCSGYVAGDSGPGVLVIQEWWGLNDHIKDIVDRFAAEGFVALAPDLYHGEITTEPDGAGKLMMALNIADASKELSGAIDELQSRTGRDKVGVVGFCMGGGLALVVACNRPDAVAACAPFYGLIPWESGQPDWSKLEAKVEGHYARDDHFFTPEAAEALQTQLRNLGKDATLMIYNESDHAFFNDTRPEVYNAESAATAWARVLDLFRTTL